MWPEAYSIPAQFSVLWFFSLFYDNSRFWLIYKVLLLGPVPAEQSLLLTSSCSFWVHRKLGKQQPNTPKSCLDPSCGWEHPSSCFQHQWGYQVECGNEPSTSPAKDPVLQGSTCHWGWEKGDRSQELCIVPGSNSSHAFICCFMLWPCMFYILGTPSVEHWQRKKERTMQP